MEWRVEAGYLGRELTGFGSTWSRGYDADLPRFTSGTRNREYPLLKGCCCLVVRTRFSLGVVREPWLFGFPADNGGTDASIFSRVTDPSGPEALSLQCAHLGAVPEKQWGALASAECSSLSFEWSTCLCKRRALSQVLAACF